MDEIDFVDEKQIRKRNVREGCSHCGLLTHTSESCPLLWKRKNK